MDVVSVLEKLASTLELMRAGKISLFFQYEMTGHEISSTSYPKRKLKLNICSLFKLQHSEAQSPENDKVTKPNRL